MCSVSIIDNGKLQPIIKSLMIAWLMLFDDLSQDCNAAEQCKMTILYFMVHFC